MKRAAVTIIIAATVAVPAVGQSVARDGAVEQAIQDTLSASYNRRQVPVDSPQRAASHAAVSTTIDEATTWGGTFDGQGTTGRTWAETFHGLIRDGISGFLTPINIGSLFQKPTASPTGGFGGGGSWGTWVEDLDCSAIKLEFDASNHLIVPSFSLEVGKPITFVPVGSTTPNHWANGPDWRASSMQSVARWWLHNLNAGRVPQRWYGVVGPYTPAGGSAQTCITAATQAFRGTDNVIVPRETVNGCFTQEYVWNYANHSGQNLERQCPQDSNSAGDFHFYGDAQGWNGQHLHACTWYVPNPSLGEGGYRIHKQTSYPMKGATFPASLPAAWKECALDKKFIKRLTDAVQRRMVDKPTYTGVPYAPIEDTDSRPNDTKVVDLQDEPIGGANPSPNPTNVTNPPPPDPAPPSTTTTNVTVDFGPNPNVGSPTLENAPTNILDPVFDWLPDLPSIQLNVAGAQCPTWQMQPFDGPEWTLVMDDHCPFIADNAALISTIMLLGFTVGAAMIILRA